LPAFFLALLAAALATLASREAVRVARLAEGLGSAAGLIVAIWMATLASSAFAGWVGARLAMELAPDAKTMLVAFALALGAIELVVLRAGPAPREPTRSTVAILLVLLAAQLTDAARLLVLAIAASTGGPWLAAAGGALGSGAVLTAAWALGAEWEAKLPLKALRWGTAALLLLAALVAGLSARGVLG
jgi:putative Ca2+/H+ antiporter (TMEM165/GDT1 family)